MSLSVTMNKKIQKKLFVLYEVKDYINNSLFYIAIDLQNKKLNYYNNYDDTSRPILSIDYLEQDKNMAGFPNICRGTSNWVIAQMYKATLSNNFPETLNYNSL